MDEAVLIEDVAAEAVDQSEQYKYFMRPDPNQREFVGDVQTERDELTGKDVKYRLAKVGMVRNAKEDAKRVLKVLLSFDGVAYPPHIRVDHAKPLQGWYQDKHNVPGIRAVLFEGVLVSTIFDPWLEWSKECLRRIQVRNGGKPIKDEQVRAKHRTIAQIRTKAALAGEKVIDLPGQDPLPALRQYLEAQLNGL